MQLATPEIYTSFRSHVLIHKVRDYACDIAKDRQLHAREFGNLGKWYWLHGLIKTASTSTGKWVS